MIEHTTTAADTAALARLSRGAQTLEDLATIVLNREATELAKRLAVSLIYEMGRSSALDQIVGSIIGADGEDPTPPEKAARLSVVPR